MSSLSDSSSSSSTTLLLPLVDNFKSLMPILRNDQQQVQFKEIQLGGSNNGPLITIPSCCDNDKNSHCDDQVFITQSFEFLNEGNTMQVAKLAMDHLLYVSSATSLPFLHFNFI